jgi:hypothetical protein
MFEERGHAEMNGIEFIDRPLLPNEQGHYRCNCCGVTMSADAAAMHKCRPTEVGVKRKW